MTTLRETNPELFRDMEETIDLEIIEGEKVINLPFRKPGMIQVAEIIRLVVETFTPRTINLETLKKLEIEEVDQMDPEILNSLSEAEVNVIYRDNLHNLELEAQFQAAVDAMGVTIGPDEEITQETAELTGKKVYTSIFFKKGNIDIIEVLVRDCFELEARELKDDVLMILVGRLMTYLLDLSSTPIK